MRHPVTPAAAAHGAGVVVGTGFPHNETFYNAFNGSVLSAAVSAAVTVVLMLLSESVGFVSLIYNTYIRVYTIYDSNCLLISATNTNVN